MPTMRYIDTAGLGKGYDVADLIESGVTGDALLQWLKKRARPGIIPESIPAKRPKKPPTKKPKDKGKPKPEKTAPAPPGNVVPLKATEDDLGVPPEYSEDALTESFSRKYKNSLIYVAPWGAWMIWEKSRWQADETNIVMDLSRKICKIASTEAQQRQDLGARSFKIANQISQLKTHRAVAAMATSDRRHAALPAQFDADPWILNTPTGVIDLKTGELRSARRDDYASKCTAVGPDGECPTWMRFLETTTDGDKELQSYLQRMAGYCLTGSTAEHVFFFVYGTGGNGKGTFINQIDWLLNSYSRVAQMETFTEQKFAKHSAEIAYFQGSRMVTAQESEEGKRWNEARIKAMTGGDPITANFMHKNPFTFQPSFKLLFAGNHKPALRNVDEAIKRRMHVIPFDKMVAPKDRDPFLPRKLRAEAGGILKWAVRGCLEWQESMLNPPERVLATTEEYFETEDTMGNFFAECCDVGKFCRVRTTVLYTEYTHWAKRTGEYVLPRKRFLDVLRVREIPSETKNGERVVMGVALKQKDGFYDD